MNERMQHLADLAEKYADDNFKGEPTYSEAYDSKFAELIVQECVDVADHSNVTGKSIVGERIKQHFGVEE